MIFFYLLFAHLLGDFVFQTYELVKLKKKSLFGLFLHCFIHFSLSFFIIFLFFRTNIQNLFIAIIFVSIAHFFIDLSKIKLESKTKKRVSLFIIDQILHIVVIFIASEYLSVFFNNPEKKLMELLIFLSVLIVLVQGIEVFNYQRLLEIKNKSKFKRSTKNLKNRIIILIVLTTIYYIIKYLF